MNVTEKAKKAPRTSSLFGRVIDVVINSRRADDTELTNQKTS